ncbi:hypothetical protein OVY01_08620 [Robbsia sp. Bb-Pol-6]|uniref:Uncharacterized protein n=1 Tax=Robbsia betulipollinis TaxID=2981849 RepID=A0ABT3ZL81_9BURK|nr:hypothetical protein [Robbsia betulipollinis]MCY0387296.1 hypothetical protein [Robbsia betulipollinis]
MGRFVVGARRGIVRVGLLRGRLARVGRKLGQAAGRTMETAGTWLVSLMIGVFVVHLLLGAENRATRDAWRGERFTLTLRQLADRFENDLALGLDPIGNGAGARMLDVAYGRDAALVAVRVVDRHGTILLDSDRGGVGGRVPAAVRHAADIAGAWPWRARVGPQWIQGVAIHNAFGEWVADVMLTYADSSAAPPCAAPSGTAAQGGAAWLAAAVTFLLACGCATAVLARLHGAPAARAVAREQADGRRIAMARLAALEHCLETVDCDVPRQDVQ